MGRQVDLEGSWTLEANLIAWEKQMGLMPMLDASLAAQLHISSAFPMRTQQHTAFMSSSPWAAFATDQDLLDMVVEASSSTAYIFKQLG